MNKKPKEKLPVNFQDVLDAGAKVDDIFKDQPYPKGSDPFELPGADVPEVELTVAEEAIGVEPDSGSDLKPLQMEGGFSPVVLEDQDSLFCLNRKYVALEALFELINKDCSFQDLIDQILEIAVTQVKSEAASFLEVDYEKNAIFFRSVKGRTESTNELFQFSIPMGKGVVGFVCKNKQAMRLSKIEENSIYLKSVSASVGFEAQNLIAVPVIINGETFGCVELLNRLGEEQFSDADKEVLQSICCYAGKLIEHRLKLAEIYRQFTLPERKAA